MFPCFNYHRITFIDLYPVEIFSSIFLIKLHKLAHIPYINSKYCTSFSNKFLILFHSQLCQFDFYGKYIYRVANISHGHRAPLHDFFLMAIDLLQVVGYRWQKKQLSLISCREIFCLAFRLTPGKNFACPA